MMMMLLGGTSFVRVSPGVLFFSPFCSHSGVYHCARWRDDQMVKTRNGEVGEAGDGEDDDGCVLEAR